MNDTSPQRIAVDMKPVMNTFLSQLKLLLGVAPVVSFQIMLSCMRLWFKSAKAFSKFQEIFFKIPLGKSFLSKSLC